MSISGFSRYVFGEKYILGSRSFSMAVKKAKTDLEQYGEDNLYYKQKTFWREYQFLFMIQYIEHNLAEFISSLAKERKINEDCLQEFKSYSNIDKKRKGTDRAFSPYALAIQMGLELGKLINIVEKTNKFKNKKKVIGKLNRFNNFRIEFIHKSFSSSRDMDKTVRNGLKCGKELLNTL